MHPKLAEYRQQLTQTDTLWQQAQLLSVYFEAMETMVRVEDDRGMDPIAVFEILYHNYENPRAVNCFIFYDIEDNKLRVRIAKYLLEKSCQRIQKSVYLANIDKRQYQEIIDTCKELEPVLGEYDSIFFVPIGEYHLAEMHMIGRDVDMSFSRSNQHVIFI